MALRITVWAVNQVARLTERAIMRFPLETDLDALDQARPPR